MPPNLCRSCLLGLRPRPRPIPALNRTQVSRLHTSSRSLDHETDPESPETSDTLSPADRARASAWYLDPPPPSHSSTSSPSAPRLPVFSTFDPSRTTSSPATRSIPALPPHTPSFLRPLHTFLTSSEASDVLDPSSVVFLHTPSAPARSVGSGELIRGEGDAGAGATWEWVVVLLVRGTGKGVVGRAERAVRRWVGHDPVNGLENEKREVDGDEQLYGNPLPPYAGGIRTGEPKLPTVPEGTDWSMIAPRDSGVCINLFTAEGRERWDLEELWSGRSTLLNRDEEG